VQAADWPHRQSGLWVRDDQPVAGGLEDPRINSAESIIMAILPKTRNAVILFHYLPQVQCAVLALLPAGLFLFKGWSWFTLEIRSHKNNL
jgi:hypothetical protein